METFHVIGQKVFSESLFKEVDKIIIEAQMNIIRNKITHSGKEIPMLVFAANKHEAKPFLEFGDYEHFLFINDGVKRLLDSYDIPYNKIGECKESDLDRASLLIRNYLYEL